VHHGQESWFTPALYLDAARAVLGSIDCAPASCIQAQAKVQAKVFYSAEENKLKRRWQGKVWLNPPYTRGVIDRFVEKLIVHYLAGEIPEAICLTHNRTISAVHGQFTAGFFAGTSCYSVVASTA
jgi:hypothetical protein